MKIVRNLFLQKIIANANKDGLVAVIFDSENTLLKLMKAMNGQNIFPRRYFYPTLDSLSFLKSGNNCPVASSIASRILCLPLFDSLELSEIEQVCAVIKKEIN